jgi:ubiquinone/menaquinone biosynthesis C-methylase UbiE
MKAPPTRLHLGCGNRYIPGFFHVDLAPAPHVDWVGKVEELSFVASDSIELIYASHVLEHFGRHVFRTVLTEWYRVLKAGGVLRLAVPDFGECARLYCEGKLGQFNDIVGLICGGQRDANDFHKMIFDRPFLSAELSAVGFREVRQWDWRVTEHAGIDDYSQAYLPHMDKERGILVSLNLEAVK